MRRTVLAIAAASALASAAAPVMAEETIQAVYRVKLTDPTTGAAYFVDRNSIRSWPSKKDCERDRREFSGYHIDRVRAFDIKTEEGEPLVVSMDQMFCVAKN